MDSEILSEAFNRGIDPLLDLLTPDQVRQISDYHAEEALQARIEELAGRSTQGELTEEERAEYEGYARANRFLSVFQARARRRLVS